MTLTPQIYIAVFRPSSHKVATVIRIVRVEGYERRPCEMANGESRRWLKGQVRVLDGDRGELQRLL